MGVFYRVADADPDVIARDERTKDTVSATEFLSFSGPLTDGSAGRIRVPVLVAVGQHDELFCGAEGSDCATNQTVQAQEANAYRSGCLHTYVLPEAGHDINLHRNAPDWYAQARQFSDRYGGTSGSPTTC